jgi:hypothetical protein
MGAIYGGFPRGCCWAFRCHRRPRGRATVSLSGRHRFAGCRFLAGMPASSAPFGKSATPRDAAEPFGPTNGGFPAASRTDPSSRRRRPRRSMLQTTRRHRNCPTSGRRTAKKMENPEPFIRTHDRPAVRVPWRHSGSGSSSIHQTPSVYPTDLQMILGCPTPNSLKTKLRG